MDELEIAESNQRRGRRLRVREQNVIRHPAMHCNIDTFTSNSVQTFDIGLMDKQCLFCNAFGFRGELKGTQSRPHFGRLCCRNNSFHVPLFPSLPQGLHDLYFGATAESRYFQSNIRKFNSSMAMASCQVNDATVRRGAPGAFKIYGQLHRRIGNVLNSTSSTPKCLQVYFYDPAYQATLRASQYYSTSRTEHDKQLELRLFTALEQILRCHNSYLRSFLSINEFIRSRNLNPEEIRFELHETNKPPAGEHPGRYHLPSAPEVSALMPEFVSTSRRNIVCSIRTNTNNDSENLAFFTECHRSYDPLAYPLLFPYGTDGWHLMFRCNENPNRKITLEQYMQYHLTVRSETSFLHHGRKLFQQWLTDQYVKIETQRLQFYCNNQQTLRSNLYRGVIDSLAQDNVHETGRMTILPSSHTGSDRWYHNNYQDAMALCRVYGKPDLFLTMTMDVNSEEVTRELKPGQTPYDRPDLLCRIFNIKLKSLIDDIVVGGVFGKCIAHVHVIEFQKRGAPHAHILIWLELLDRSPATIDNMISAEIPDCLDEELHNLVIEKMIHGPCGIHNTKLGCMRNGSCKRRFPREFSDTTTLGDKSFAQYRRRSPDHGGHTATKWVRGRQVTLDNRWVVPYSPYLLKKYKCHINVEYCHTISSVKYLFLYHFKGVDKITTEGIDPSDEITKFEVRRYLSSCFCYWRIAEFKTVQIEPTVVTLTVHLEDEQQVTYHPNSVNALSAAQRSRHTTLTQYFDNNLLQRSILFHNIGEEENSLARTTLSLKYEDYPSYYVWHASDRKWRARQRQSRIRSPSIGRMVSIHPNQGEKFFLRMLLKHKVGATSFDDLLTVHHIQQPTYKAACMEMGLLASDKMWIDTLHDAVETQACCLSIRYLFCNIIVYCGTSDPRQLFDMFAEEMSNDIRRQYNQRRNVSANSLESAVTNDLLKSINNILQEQGKQNSDYGLEMPVIANTVNEAIHASDVDDNAEEFFRQNVVRLNEEQLHIFSQLRQHIDYDQGGCYNLDAPGGSGKTFLCNVLLAYIRQNNEIALATALSGIAATLLSLGATFHSTFGVPIPVYHDSCSKIALDSPEADRIRRAKLIVVDEVSMMNKHLLDLLDRMLQELMQNTNYMGGKLILLMHDFRQILCVIPGGSRSDIVSASVTFSNSWHHFVPLSLKENMRVQRLIKSTDTAHRIAELRNYTNWLLQLGNGSAPTVHQNIIEIPSYMVRKSPVELEETVFDNLLGNFTDVNYLYGRAIMSTTNDIIQQRNFELIQRLPGETLVSRSIDSCIEEEHNATYEAETLNKVNASGIPPHRLALKENACIILIRNLDVKRRFVNGTRLLITKLTPYVILAKKLKDDGNSEILIPRIPMECKDTDFPVPFKRLQFPVLGAYYLSLNRAQGQSLERAGIYLKSSVFTHGQLYVGVSRVGDPRQIFIYAKQNEFDNLEAYLERGKTFTRNVTYPEIFNSNS